MTKNSKANKKKKRKSGLLTHVDLFAGCGGLSLGMEQAGFTPVFVNELNQDALATYKENRHHSLGGLPFNENELLHSRNIKSLNKYKLNELKSNLLSLGIGIHFERNGRSNIDLVAGGPPCQGYSGIGHRRSYSVEKKEMPSNRLYSHMARMIKFLKPRIFLFENVQGILTSRWTLSGCKGEIWDSVWKCYKSLAKNEGYELRYTLLYSKNYGVPQNRPRVIMVGIRNDIVNSTSLLDPSNHPTDAVTCNFLPHPIPDGYPNVEDVIGDLVDPTALEFLNSGHYQQGPFQTTEYVHNIKKGSIQEYFRKTKDGTQLMNKGKPVTDQQYSKHTRKVVEKFTYMLNSNGNIPKKYKTNKFAQRVLPAKWNNKGPNITIASLPDDYIHFSQPRSLTVREWARLQMFPDWYQFKGNRTTGGLRRAGNLREKITDRELPKYTQIGNAIPVTLAKVIGDHFRKILSDSIA